MDDDHDSDDEEEEDAPLEFDTNTPLEDVWKLHVDERCWYTQCGNNHHQQLLYYVRPHCRVTGGTPGVDFFTSLQEFGDQYVRVQYPDWKGVDDEEEEEEDASEEEEEESQDDEEEDSRSYQTPIPRGRRQLRVVTEAKTKERRSRRTVATSLERTTILPPFDWKKAAANFPTKLLSHGEAWKLLSRIGFTKKKSEFFVPGHPKDGFRSLQGVREFLRHCNIPCYSNYDTNLEPVEQTSLLFWIHSAEMSSAQVREILSCASFKKDDQLLERLYDLGFSSEDEKLFVPDFRCQPPPWQYGVHWLRKSELHTRVRTYVRDEHRDDALDPRLLRWCLADLELHEANQEQVDLMLPSYVDTEGENPREESAVKPSPKRNVTQHWWDHEDFPSNRVITSILTAMGCKQGNDDDDGYPTFALPWWPEKCFSLSSIQVALRTAGVQTESYGKISTDDAELLRRWAIFSILPIEELGTIPPPDNLRGLLVDAGWSPEPGRLFVPDYRSIEKTDGDWVCGTHYFVRTGNNFLDPVQERNIRAYIRRNPSAAGESNELLKWAANDSKACIEQFDNLDRDKILALVRLSMGESNDDYLSQVSLPLPWKAVSPLIEKLGFVQKGRTFTHAKIPGEIWKELKDVQVFCLENGVPCLELLSSADRAVVETWVCSAFLPSRNMEQFTLAKALLHFISLSELLDKAGVAPQQGSDMAKVRTSWRKTETLPVLSEQTHRLSRRSSETKKATSSNDLFLLAVRLWAATDPEPLPVHVNNSSEEYPTPWPVTTNARSSPNKEGSPATECLDIERCGEIMEMENTATPRVANLGEETEKVGVSASQDNNEESTSAGTKRGHSESNRMGLGNPFDFVVGNGQGQPSFEGGLHPIHKLRDQCESQTSFDCSETDIGVWAARNPITVNQMQLSFQTGLSTQLDSDDEAMEVDCSWTGGNLSQKSVFSGLSEEHSRESVTSKIGRAAKRTRSGEKLVSVLEKGCASP